eukprot:gnl/MRDRNA2_/MRDRNA2_57886_c0_seq1.p1 gnl/MRDRNA2_/MRDRNA2_57886_c0~~gnl/MRDRNA2_/MRDRNA2_57886_c0_seq1.p1  ORF type:complete len:296 (+),score=45.83 gnl/MRDRNA2_/MRDRNA2_57886_c0_seq1:136-1023(+)
MKDKGEQLLSTRTVPMEPFDQAVRRCLQEKLGIQDLDMLKVVTGRVKSTEEEEYSDFYPGITTIASKHFVQANIATTDPAQLQTLGIGTKEESFEYEYKGEITTFAWRPIGEAPALRTHKSWLAGHLSRKQASRRASLRGMREGSLEVITPWSSEQVKALLEKHGTTEESFGMSLEKLTNAISTGRMQFGCRCKDKKLVTTSDVIALVVWSYACDAVIVENHPLSGHPPVWPSLPRRRDDMPWDAARRLARRHLKAGEVELTSETKAFELMEEKEEVPGESMLTRKWLFCARVMH